MSEVLADNTNAERIAVAFSRVLRSAGISTPIGNVLTFVEALGLVGIDNRDNVYWAGRSTLLRRPEDISLYDKAFAVFWERRTSSSVEPDEQLIRINIEIDDETDGTDDGSSEEADDDGESITLRFSSVETLRKKDFASYSNDELHLAQDLMSQLRLVGSPRHSFRMRPTSKGSRPDLRRTIRSSLRSGGEPIRRHWQWNDPRRIFQRRRSHVDTCEPTTASTSHRGGGWCECGGQYDVGLPDNIHH